MKKSVGTILVLLVLTMITGLERFRAGVRFLISDERTAPESGSVIPLETSRSESRETRVETGDGPNSKAESLRIPTVGENPRKLSRSKGAAQWGGVRVSGEKAQFHFIRSSEIFAESKPSEMEFERLRNAIEIVAGSLQSQPIIFDASANLSSEVPFILFGRDELDLTEPVRTVFQSGKSD